MMTAVMVVMGNYDGSDDRGFSGEGGNDEILKTRYRSISNNIFKKRVNKCSCVACSFYVPAINFFI